MLQTSKVMNRDQISMREVVQEAEPDDLISFTNFDAAENANTQTFLEMKELVAHGLSIVNLIENNCHTAMVTGDFRIYLIFLVDLQSLQRLPFFLFFDNQGDREHFDDKYYPPIQRDCSPLPDIDGCLGELEGSSSQHDEIVEWDAVDVYMPENAST